MASSLTPVIVVFKGTASADEVEAYASLVMRNGGTVTHRYNGVLNGFAARISQDQFDAFREDTDRFDSPISYVELDSELTTQ